MQNLTIALVQTNQEWEDKATNLSNYTVLLETIPPIDLILLPEMFHTGFSMEAEKLAESMDESTGITWLKQTAFEKNAAIYTSLIIRENGHFYNRGVFVEPSGNITTYDKRKCFGLAGEDTVFTGGKEEVIVSFKHWSFQLQICYDLRFPEIVRNRLNQEGKPVYDVILYVANWPAKRNIHWQTLLKARAIENQCYVAGVNRIGTDGKGLSYSGDSVVVDALGKEQIITTGEETVEIVTLNKNELDEIRTILPFLKDR
jgi:omega-amidase